ncbi:hypothetical protein DY000_02042825 [Brassica cretica]|uniref:Uncharacterized protein n=1 Tax=Brassica cretica TaxID=69181 RepID=A0ABQ7BNP7_BRACR|nr:hypothetical protein DY000_02042825 [Brassica cretica]
MSFCKLVSNNKRVDRKLVPNKKQVQFKLVPKVHVYRTIADPKSRVEIVFAEQVVGTLIPQELPLMELVGGGNKLPLLKFAGNVGGFPPGSNSFYISSKIFLFHSCWCKDLSVVDLLKSDGSKAAVKRLSELESELEARSKLLVVEMSVENVESARAKQVNLLKLLARAKQVMTVPSTGRSLRDLVMSTRWLR